MHTFSPTSTQYEIESWIFPHPGVRRLQDASNPGPQRHSLHSVTPRVKATKEGGERARLKKGHRRWHSNENHNHLGGPHGSKEGRRKGERERTGSLKTTLEWSGPLGHHSGLTTQYGKEEASQRNRHSLGHHLVVCDRLSQGDGVVVGKGRTKRNSNSTQGILEPKHHPSALRVSLQGENRSRDVGGRPSEFLGAQVSPSHRPRKQPWVSKLSAPLPSTGHSSLTKQTQQQHQPSYPRRQSSTALELHSADLRALLRSLSCRSLTMGADVGPSEGVGESCFTILGLVVTHSKPPSPSRHMVQLSTSCGAQLTDPSAVSQNLGGGHHGSLEDWFTQDAPRHQDAAESDGEEEPNPAFLGSLDYHDFLHGTSKVEAASSHGSPVSRFAHKVTRSSSHNPFPDTT